MQTEQEILHKTGELLSDPNKHCSGFYAMNAQGIATDTTSDDACRFCAIGAAMHVANVTSRFDLPPAVLLKMGEFVPDRLKVEANYFSGIFGHQWDDMTTDERLEFAKRLQAA